MDDFLKAERLSEVEMLRLENFNLKLAALTKDRDDFISSIARKYTGEDSITVTPAGTIVRTAPLKAAE